MFFLLLIINKVYFVVVVVVVVFNVLLPLKRSFGNKMYFLTLWNACFFVVLFRVFGIRGLHCFRV